MKREAQASWQLARRPFLRLPVAAATALALQAVALPAHARREDFCLFDPPITVYVNGKPVVVEVDYGVPDALKPRVDVGATDASITAKVKSHRRAREAEIIVEMTVVTRDRSRIPARMMLSVPSQQVVTDWRYGVTNTPLKQNIRIQAP